MKFGKNAIVADERRADFSINETKITGKFKIKESKKRGKYLERSRK
jgi:hypothetical protein